MLFRNEPKKKEIVGFRVSKKAVQVTAFFGSFQLEHGLKERKKNKNLLAVLAIKVIDDLAERQVGRNHVVGLVQIHEEQLVGTVAVLSDIQDDVLAVIRDSRSGAVGRVGGIEVDKNILGLRSTDLVVVTIFF